MLQREKLHNIKKKKKDATWEWQDKLYVDIHTFHYLKFSFQQKNLIS